jgi:hypothetical protein
MAFPTLAVTSYQSRFDYLANFYDKFLLDPDLTVVCLAGLAVWILSSGILRGWLPTKSAYAAGTVGLVMFGFAGLDQRKGAIIRAERPAYMPAEVEEARRTASAAFSEAKSLARQGQWQGALAMLQPLIPVIGDDESFQPALFTEAGTGSRLC